MNAMIITGASSGIGRHLAFEYASRGFALGLTARRFELLQKLRNEIYEKFGSNIKVEIRTLDVTDYKKIYSVLKDLAHSLGNITHVVANAGLAGSSPIGSGKFLHDKFVIETNLIGAMATVDAAAEIFKSQKSPGHIIGISSIAGFRGFPGNASYCASKAGFTVFLESARRDLKDFNILVSTIHPGFIATDINAHIPSKPFVVSVEKGASELAKLIDQKVIVSSVPKFPWGLIGFLLKWIPNVIWQRLKF
ncbi:MAG TPA: SDR family NAD(P)-dependent oxidoreductase [Leptospiraceae bacterium]|nr:SDR family NAD(P)-dependent oxidoreductase [Leptospiraceae bacterium]HMW03736.1 SDR family NAD(P)-dependent oxidoreductase [Leptospiraceae bacterium]HMX31849.1 SDR family NAD(P)-dependent oxidoreductase [Leptospiraceae bacterium]HMY29716.1 SDR family NAD(P)-dependent oxidoreductase [Leptospiraceae bacterium]HMZ64008.1 SDR family NAD(P)-dependent oxidoreductase [Leptospiraceae bacterium]